MEDAEELRALAERCRHLASATDDDETRLALEGLAAYYEAQAAGAAGESDIKPSPPLEG